MKSQNRKLQELNDEVYAGPSLPAVHDRHLCSSPSSGEPNSTQPAPPSQQQLQYPQSITTFDSSMVVAVIVVLAVLFVIGIFSICIHRFSDDYPTPINNSRNHSGRLQGPHNMYSFNSARKGLDPEIIRSLPLFYYHEDAKYQIISCAICLTELEEREIVKMIPYCKHVFHVGCIDRWLSIHATCPVCRSNHFVEGEFSGGRGVGCLHLVVDGVADATVDRGVREVRGGSTVGNASTCVEGAREMASMRIRRSCSWTVLTERASLKRSWSV